LGIVQGDFFTVEIKAVGEALGVVEDRINRCSKPLFDVPANEITGKEEEQQSGDKGEGNKEQYEFSFEMGSSDFSLSLEIEFYQTPGEYEKKDEKKEEHDDLQ
jgi:hypothetical protein